MKAGAIAGAGMAVPGVAYAAPSPNSEAEIARPGTEAQIAADSGAGEGFTRGIGVYPGLPAEHFGPTSIADTSGQERNLALLRPAFHSSSYDYNLTAQLVTDGIRQTDLPVWVATAIDGQILPRPQREVMLDHFQSSVLELAGTSPAVEVHLLGGAAPPVVDRVQVFTVVPDSVPPASLLFTASVSTDGHLWRKAGSAPGSLTSRPGTDYPPGLTAGSHLLAPSIPLSGAAGARYFRFDLAPAKTPAGTAAEAHLHWRLGQVAFFDGGQRVQVGGPYRFTSAWKSAGVDREWVYVDLGASLAFDRVALHWIARAAEGQIEVSDDAATWRVLEPLPTAPATTLVDDIRLKSPARGRYVRVLMTRPATANGYILSEFEVYGKGGFVSEPKPAPAVRADGGLDLAGGRWRLIRAGSETGEAVATAGFPDAGWMVATVPGTVLSSYLNAGAIPDPNFGQNQLMLSDAYFYSDFWYRTEFPSPALPNGRRATLHFAGVNWKAEVYLNGERLGPIEGGFRRGQFDVTAKLRQGGAPNALAVRIRKNDTPGSCKQKTYETTGLNGGALGADNPTYHASIGWDWIPTIRGRNIGIWGDVSLAVTGAVTLANPLVTTRLPLPKTDVAEVTLEVVAANGSSSAVSGTLRGRLGEVEFSHPVSLPGNGRQTVRISSANTPGLRIDQPKLWWPAGYGEPHLYDVEMRFEADGAGGPTVHHELRFVAGLRQMTASETGGALRLFINGRRFIGRGGNWGFGESMLRYRAREYDAAVRYHREMNFTMIRNWVGQIGDDAFFEACDRHGIVVWQDFWLANPWDGPVPENNDLFLDNARDFLLRIRRHASLGLYCGRNEWFPPPVLERGLRALLAELHPDIHYIGSSADGPVSGHGPYRALPAPEYFRLADKKLHSELGAPAIPPIESVRLMMPEKALWPQGLDWGLHDFTLAGAQGGAQFLSLIDESYGGASTAEEWVELAQFVVYESYRAMLEAQSRYRMGLLLWMSHPCWPSFVWQTYDYYFEPTAAYFGSKKGSEPVHIQWNSAEETIEVVNYSGGARPGLEAEVEILNLDGSRVSRRSAALSSTEDSVATPLRMEYPSGLSAVHYLRLTLREKGNEISSNFYLRGLEQGDLRAIRTLPEAQLQATSSAARQGQRWVIRTELQNRSQTPALMVRLSAVRERSGDRILPAIFSENYIALMPGESRTVETECEDRDTRGERPRMVVSGFNVARAEIR